MTVRLHIERLVVDGLDFLPADARRLEAALAAELTARLSSDDQANWTSLAVAASSPCQMELPAGNDAEAIGRRAAAVLQGGLRP